jgi:hypothetical protein
VSDPLIDPLPPGIAALLEREKLAYPEDAAMTAAAFAAVETAITGGGPSGGGGGGEGGEPGSPPGDGLVGGSAAAVSFGAKAVAAIAAGAFLAGGLVGGVAVSRTTRPGEETVPIAASATSSLVDAGGADALPRAAPSALVVDTPPPARTEIADASGVPTTPGKEAADTRGDLTRERELLDVARASLSRGNPRDAITAAERHAQRWPRGHLVEEREVVWIQSLAAAGRQDDAVRRASQFRRSFPNSVLTPAVDAAVRASDEKRSTP